MAIDVRTMSELEGKHTILLDLSGFERLDSAFLRFLVRLHERANAEQPTVIELTGTTPRVLRVLEITGLSRMFKLHPLHGGER
jgi:anti-anti-sigma factor